METLARELKMPNWYEVPDDFELPDYKDGMNYLVNGEILSWRGEGIEVRSPLLFQDGAQIKVPLIGSYPGLDEAEALRALRAAERAYGGGAGKWPQMTTEQRIEALKGFVWRMRPLERQFALLQMWETAKPYRSCLDEFKRTMKYIEDTITHLYLLEEESSGISKAENYIYQVRRCPLGICLCMGPFNYPLNETFALAIPALIMGNTVIIKPPRYGALCTIPLLDAFARSLPAGVVNVINGHGPVIIPPIMKTGKIAVLGFTGSTGAARQIANAHPANNRLRTILGLEAKNPAFVFADADLDVAVKECINGALEFNGQRCTAIKHILVEEKIADHFLARLSAEVEKVKCGLPWEEGVTITALAETNKSEWLGELIQDALAHGAHIVNPSGGQVSGNLFHPTVIYPVTGEMKIWSVEQFGPVIPVSSFAGFDQIANYMIHSEHGQQASVFTTSAANASSMIDLLVNQVSRVNLNAQCRRSPDELPFTGRKDSAEGTLSVIDALRSFSIRSLVVANEQGRELFFRTLESGQSRFLKI
ncbi:MAG: aldehyde dehydrogenase family protein [Syntrophomonadaceae bacterium]|nr:aldehyde dehydrogenase family protein [Syntrophomonadaceae bacterium]